MERLVCSFQQPEPHSSVRHHQGPEPKLSRVVVVQFGPKPVQNQTTRNFCMVKQNLDTRISLHVIYASNAGKIALYSSAHSWVGFACEKTSQKGKSSVA